VLLACTAATVTFCGSLWEGAFDDAATIARLFALALSHPERLVSGLPFALCLLAILGAHEMGHYLACRRHGIPATLPFFIPGPPPFGTFGAVIRIRGVIPDRDALFDIAAAGPVAGFLAALPILISGILRARPIVAPASEPGIQLGSPIVAMLFEYLVFGDADIRVGSIYLAGWFGMLVTSMNLFPVGQLDGGHASYAWSRRLHRMTSWVTIVGVLLLVIAQTLLYGQVSMYTVWCAVLLLMRDRHPRLADETRPLGPARRLGVLVMLLMFVMSFIPVPISL
jgi:membrane-associated protease RseP (regulator of RpoE activity)